MTAQICVQIFVVSGQVPRHHAKVMKRKVNLAFTVYQLLQ